MKLKSILRLTQGTQPKVTVHMECTRMVALPLTRAPTLTFARRKGKRISARQIQTVELKFNAVGRGRLVSTFVEKEESRI